jgi:hypothetical protein
MKSRIVVSLLFGYILYRLAIVGCSFKGAVSTLTDADGMMVADFKHLCGSFTSFLVSVDEIPYVWLIEFLLCTLLVYICLWIIEQLYFHYRKK